jgi:hypothetical protein
MTDYITSADELAAHIKSFTSIAEQRAIREHNEPIIEALSIAVKQAQRLFGSDTPEYQAVCRVFDAAIAKQNNRLW